MANIKKEFERLGWECTGDDDVFTIKSGNITGKVFALPDDREAFVNYILQKKDEIKEAVPNEMVVILAADFFFETYINGKCRGVATLPIVPKTVNMYLEKDKKER